MNQPTFADLEYECKKRKTRRELFLERMDGLIPWGQLESRIRPYYPEAGRGRHPYELSAMLPIHCVQLFYNLSDPGMEDMLYEVESVRRFVGLRLSGPLPDETTILNFRHLLEEHDLGEGLFKTINVHLETQGLRLREGTIVDASIIEAPSSTKNRARERDPEMHQTKKGNKWSFGMKVHIGADEETGVVHSVAMTSANVHDVTETHRYYTVERRGCGAMRGIRESNKREENRELDVEWRVAMKPGRRRQLAPESEEALAEEAQGVGQGEGGASVPVCEASLWLRQGAVSWTGQEHATAGVAAGVCQLDDSRAPLGGVTREKCAQIRLIAATRPGRARFRSPNRPDLGPQQPDGPSQRIEHLRTTPAINSIQHMKGYSEVP